jgi:hypothetical protein
MGEPENMRPDASEWGEGEIPVGSGELAELEDTDALDWARNGVIDLLPDAIDALTARAAEQPLQADDIQALAAIGDTVEAIYWHEELGLVRVSREVLV